MLNENVSQNQLVADRLLANVFGVMVLYSLGSTPALREQLNAFKATTPQTLADSEIESTIKDALNVGLIRQQTAVHLVKLMVGMKGKRLKPESLTDSLLGGLLAECRFQVVKPHVLFRGLVKQVSDGDMTVREMIADMYKTMKARKKEFVGIVGTFMDITRRYAQKLGLDAEDSGLELSLEPVEEPKQDYVSRFVELVVSNSIPRNEAFEIIQKADRDELLKAVRARVKEDKQYSLAFYKMLFLTPYSIVGPFGESMLRAVMTEFSDLPNRPKVAEVGLYLTDLIDRLQAAQTDPHNVDQFAKMFVTTADLSEKREMLAVALGFIGDDLTHVKMIHTVLGVSHEDVLEWAITYLPASVTDLVKEPAYASMVNGTIIERLKDAKVRPLGLLSILSKTDLDASKYVSQEDLKAAVADGPKNIKAYAAKFVNSDDLLSIADKAKEQYLSGYTSALDILTAALTSDELREVLESIPANDILANHPTALHNRVIVETLPAQKLTSIANAGGDVYQVEGMFDVLATSKRKLQPAELAYILNHTTVVGVSVWSAKELITKEVIEGATDYLEALENGLARADLKEQLLNLVGHDAAAIKTARELNKVDLIHPSKILTPEKMLDVLQINNISITPSEPPKVGERIADYLKRIPAANIGELHAEDENLSQAELERRSVEYDVFNAYRHGNVSVLFEKSFSVKVPVMEEGAKRFDAEVRERGDAPNFMSPMFHGTSSLAASFICRNGFRIIEESSAIQITGKAIGNGVYVTNVLDKASAYVSDDGFDQTTGSRGGYLLEMDCLLGRRGSEWDATGLAGEINTTGYLSPEWVLFRPNEQLRITKAHQVRIIPAEEMQRLHQRYGTNENVFQVKSFKTFVNEGYTSKRDCVSYVFADGMIPTKDGVLLKWTEYPQTANVRVEASGMGPIAKIFNTDGLNQTYYVKSSAVFLNSQDDLERFLSLI